MSKKLSLFLLLLSVGLLTALVAGPVFAGNDDGQGQVIPGKFIVLVKDGASPASVADRHGAAAEHVYGAALNGFAGALSPSQVADLRKDGDVLSVEQDRLHRLVDVPTGVDRAEADLNPSGTDSGADTVNVHVAVIDTGIAVHPDLDLKGGVNFAGGPSSKYTDNNGHGTHVAGSVGAMGGPGAVMGIAPGADLWAVRVCTNVCPTSDMIAGINWVATQKAEAHDGDANAGIDFAVATMSISSPDDSSACDGDSDALHLAICGLVDEGVVFTLAAGNGSRVKNAYPEVLAVSALADFDGKAGGAGSSTCRSDVDDTLANFSNYGPEVDIAAPGVCITSTWKDGGYNTISGTSMATPHVAGAVALYVNANGGPAIDAAGVDAIESAIINAAWPQSDPCGYTNERGYSEPLLSVNSAVFGGGDGSCEGATPTKGITVSPTSGLITDETGGQDTFSVVLDAEPTDNVSIDISSNDVTEGTAAPATLNFTTDNWNVPQVVTITGDDDAEVDGNVGYTVITAAATSGDVDYSGMDPSDVSVTNMDDDSPTGSISGTVTDDTTTPSPIEGATVETDTGQSTITAADGTYTIADVPTGSVTVTASATGYTSANQDVDVVEGDNSGVNFALAPASTTGLVVNDVQWSERSYGPWRDLNQAVTVSAAGVTIEATITNLTTGINYGSATATTNDEGKASFTLTKAPNGEYEFLITNASLDEKNPSCYDTSTKVTGC